MPTTKSAEKQVRVAERKKLRNKSARSQVKTSITKAEKLIFSGELKTSQEAVVAAISALDKGSRGRHHQTKQCLAAQIKIDEEIKSGAGSAC